MVFFDPTTVERNTVSKPLPNGEYVVKIDRTILKDNDDKCGLNVFFTVFKPDAHLDRSCMDNFNLKHPKAEVQEIGQRRFAQLLDTIGLGNAPLQSETQIEGKFVKVVLGQKPDYRTVGAFRNEVLKYMAVTASDLEGISFPSDLSDDIPFEAPF